MTFAPRPAYAAGVPLRAPFRRPRRSIPLLIASILAVTALAVAPSGALPGAADASVAQAACPSFQGLVNSAATGSTITIPACTYNEVVTVSKKLTINATGAIIDGGNSRTDGLVIKANDVTVNGLTVKRINNSAGSYHGAVWTSGISRFTFQNGKVTDSATICVSLNGGSGHKIINSELSYCRKEGFFTNNVSDTLFQGNRIRYNNQNRNYDPFVEAGGGKAMASQRVTFDNNEVSFNKGPGIWFDNGVVDVTAKNNRVHHNDQAGIFFEVSNGATITGNKAWENGWADGRGWGYGAGITISSSDRAKVSNNIVAWSPRGISVISQGRAFSPHNGNTLTGNTIMQAGGGNVAGFYDDHGGTLWQSGNGNSGSGNRYWVAAGEPSGSRFIWSSSHSTLASYNGTPGEESGTYLTTSQRNSVLATAGMPLDDGSTPPGGTPPPPPPAGPKAGVPTLSFSTGQLGVSPTNAPGRAWWPATSGAAQYQLQLRRDGGSWTAVSLPSATALAVPVLYLSGHTYDARLRVRTTSSSYGPWAYSLPSEIALFSETSGQIAYSSGWTQVNNVNAVGGAVRYHNSTNASARFTFTGRAVAWIATRSSVSGQARVYLDGTLYATQNLKSASKLPRAVAYYARWGVNGSHTIEIRLVGNGQVDIDSFLIIR